MRETAPRNMAVLDRVNRDWLDRLAADGRPPVYTLTPDEARSDLLRAWTIPVRKPDAQVEDRIVNWGPRALRLRTIRPGLT
jgi:acetyl esterase